MEYTFTKSKSKKLTFENPNAPGGQRKADVNVFTGEVKVHSPVALDLNGSGAIETTGATTAQVRTGADPLGQTVAFDIDGDGATENIEWLSGTGDSLLVDNRDGMAASDMSGQRLFGDQGGQFASGYQKLGMLDGRRRRRTFR